MVSKIPSQQNYAAQVPNAGQKRTIVEQTPNLSSPKTAQSFSDTNNTKNKTLKQKIGLTSSIGAGAGLGIGAAASALYKDTVKEVRHFKEKITADKLVDFVGDLIVKKKSGGIIEDGIEVQTFFSKLRPPSTRRMEYFIESNHIDYRTSPEKIKALFKEFAKTDEPMKKHIEQLQDSLKYYYHAGADSTSSLKKIANDSRSLFIRKEASNYLKKSKWFLPAAGALGALVAGGLCYALNKINKKDESKQ